MNPKVPSQYDCAFPRTLELFPMPCCLVSIAARLISPRRLSPIQIHLFLQETAQLGSATPTLYLAPRHRRPSIRRVDRWHRRCVGRRRFGSMLVRRKVLSLDFRPTGSDCSLVFCVHGVVGRVVAAINRVVEGAAQRFCCALNLLVGIGS